MIGLLKTISSAIATGFAPGSESGIAGAVAAVGRQIDATLTAGSVENARAALSERRRTARLRSALDEAYRGLELDRSA